MGVVRSTRDGNLGHAVVEQVFRAKVCIYMDEHPICALSLADVAGHGIAMVEMQMLLRIKADTASALIHRQLNAPVIRDTVDGSKLTVRNLQVVRLTGRCELEAVAG
jgi:hypothetical protein